MEHHSNIVPWQMLRDRKGINLKVIPVTESGELDMKAAKECIGERTRLLSIAHVSNVLGTINPIKELVLLAHERGCPVLIDAAQSVPHIPVDVQDLGCDFLAFSGHKIYGPTGIGVLYGREELLEKMPPYQGGGEMIARVTFEKTTYETLPFKFEAGTPDYVGTNALAVALRYVGAIGMDEIHSYESSLTRYAMQRLGEIEGLRIYGESAEKDAVVSFNLKGIHHLDVGTLLDRLGIAVRTGHHCAQPLMQRYDTEGMVRASFAFYNTKDEIDKLADALLRVKSMF
ncbi:MAG: cysteine desulfurase, partial [Alloprevotella sp.]|nr:cysteine desulfurase [Alloprevotella sp.]